MRRLLLLAFALCLIPMAKAQSGSVTGFCVQGATSAQTQGLSSTNKLQGIIPSCTVTLYYTGTQTQVPGSSVFSSATGTVLGNPFTASANGQWTFWASILQGYDIVLSGGIAPNVYATPFTLINQVPDFAGCGSQNGQVEASCFPGTDFAVQMGEAAAALPSRGGIITAYGFGNAASTSIQVTAQANPAKPITVKLNPATIFTLNTQFPSGTIANSVATYTSGVGGACIWPIAQGSELDSPGFNQLNGNVRLGPSAATYALACNAQQDGTEQSFQINGIGFEGNATATMKGALLHVKKAYIGTVIQNSNFYLPYGNSVILDAVGDLQMINDNVADAYSGNTVQYPGAVLTLNCTDKVTFTGGAIQDNGPFNPLIVTNNCNTSTGYPTQGLGTQNVSFHSYNTDIETQAATVGSFSGAPTNVDPIQLLDCADCLIDGMTVLGNKGAGQANLVDIQSSGSNGQTRGPIELKDISVLSPWSATCLVNNTTGAFVSPQQVCVKGTQSGSGTYGIGEYRWEGGSYPLASVTDYLDSQIVSNFQGAITNGDVNAALELGSDIGAKVNAAGAVCAYQCMVFVPPGNYPFTTTIVLPLNTFGAYGVRLDPGAVLNYNGTGVAIDTQIGPSGPGPTNMIIEGGTLNGTASATEGIHILPSQRVTIQNMLIQGFSNGDAIWLEGPDSMNVLNNNLQNNLNGLRVSPTFCTGSYPYTCSGGTTGSAWSPNAINVEFNEITVNSHWGIFEDRNGISGGGWTGSLGNKYENNDLEVNGTGGTQYGAIYIGKSTVDTVRNNYFEASPRQIVLGELGAGAFFAANSPIIRDNYFTTRTATPFNLELENALGAIIEGNSEAIQTTNSSNCFINAATGGENQTFIGHNLYLQNVSPQTGNSICVNGVPGPLVGTGSFPIVNSNYQNYLADEGVITTSATSETIAIGGITSVSQCFAEPQDGSAAAASWGAYSVWTVSGSGGVTLHHPANANVHLNIICSKGPYN